MTSPSNLQRNKTLELAITGLAFGGRGLAKCDDFVVFVTGAVPGDVARVLVTKAKNRYAEARVLEILEPSPQRRDPRCPLFGRCGGCTWQSLDYGVQLEYKARQVRESLGHLGHIEGFELRPTVGMADPWRYRNRADFSVGMSEEGAVIGFRPPGRWDSVLPLTGCHLLGQAMENARTATESWLRQARIPGWDPRTRTGFARQLLVRSAAMGREVIVSLVTAPGDLPAAGELVERVRSAVPEVVGILRATNAGKAEISSGLESQTLWGRSYLLETTRGLTIKVSSDAFFQTNTLMAHELYGLVARAAGVESDEQTMEVAAVTPSGPAVWDLYSGVGSIALCIAGSSTAVLGIEAVPSAVLDARENAARNCVNNAFFIEGDVSQVLREVAEGSRRLPPELARPDVVIVDPPRAGLSKKALARVGEVAAARIVYVSCNPATMAPNIAELQKYGYRLRTVTPVDMFPHTPHVEAVGLLSRSG